MFTCSTSARMSSRSPRAPLTRPLERLTAAAKASKRCDHRGGAALEASVVEADLVIIVIYCGIVRL
jgi:hypothetical protein